MLKKIIIQLVLLTTLLFAQFGQNKVQHRSYNWYYIQTKHFDIYFTLEGKSPAEFTASAAEDALNRITNVLSLPINNRITLVIYNSHNDFQETNTSDSYLNQGIGGFTEPFKNRVVLPFEGDYKKFRHVIHHELVHAYIQDVLYGGTIQNIISRGITLQLPLWYHEGMSEYLSSGWETMSDMFITDAAINEYLPDIQQLNGYFAYRGGQAVMRHISEKYGEKKLGELLQQIKENGSFEGGLKAAIGLTIEELNDKWKKDIKKRFWPGISKYSDPEELAKKLSNTKKDGGFYNSSPAISPQGDKIAFISDRDIYLNVYLMNALDGKIIKKIAESGTTNDFEELNILFPSLTWAPDNRRIAIAVKSDGFDAIQIIDTETEESSTIPVKLDGISNVAWSPDGKKLAFIGHNSSQSDLYTFEFENNQLTNLTNDIFSENFPAWSPDSQTLVFASDRGEYVQNKVTDDFFMFNHNYSQLDLYSISIVTNKIERLTNDNLSDETSPVCSPDGKFILFSSDKNGITNIYKMNLQTKKSFPITNSLYGLNELSVSNDGKKLVFSSLFNFGYNIYLMNNPFEKPSIGDSLELTPFMAELIKNQQTDQLVKSEKDDLKLNFNVSPYSTYIFDKVNEPKDSSKNSIIFTGQHLEKDPVGKDSVSTEYKKYVFNPYFESNIQKDSTIAFEEKVDSNGNYLVNRYKINFSPDLIYANAGYSTFYGLLGTTLLSFSDVLGNHRLIGITSMQIDLKNSDYGLSYYYLANRLDLGIQFYHTARFLYLNNNFTSELYRFRNFGAVLSASYPLSTFNRIDGSLSVLSLSSENMDNYSVPVDKVTYIVPSLSLVHDNTMWGYYSPIQGSRYNITAFGNPGFNNHRQSFYSLTLDLRKYYRFFYDNSLALRFSGGYSGGANPQRFMLGGLENWINRKFATGEIPFEKAQDFAFLTPAMPMRGFPYGEKLGSKYALINLELRMPFIRYLVTGPLPLLFQNILGNIFLDAGAAWDKNQSLQLFHKDNNGNTETKDLLIGMGTGLRTYFLFFLARFDVAWSFNGQHFSKPQYYFSIGTDF